ncbi:MAG: HD family hydrolase [Fulvimarina manganoxydans]|uniref:HD family hydrolase n=1 Tax=Fulvimarina manganoxydans TaxID=937218 RepID=UPI0023539960|nr:HD family hydrolase [Fulvimarina manganoxydans]MCK5934261.1 HD family hydrolase [Fulvimarina manganoxydans]
MLSGRRLDLLDPSPLDIEITDIAHGLARVARWNGQTVGDHAFSVAQHSLVVEKIISARLDDPRWRLAALLHDGPEYVIGDMISPFKAILGGDYKGVEARLQRVIHIRFGLPADLPTDITKAIKAADRVSAHAEAIGLAGFTEEEANMFFGRPGRQRIDPASLVPLPAKEAQTRFLETFSAVDGLCLEAARASPATSLGQDALADTALPAQEG